MTEKSANVVTCAPAKDGVSFVSPRPLLDRPRETAQLSAKTAPAKRSNPKNMLAETQQAASNNKDAMHVNILRIGDRNLLKMEQYYIERERIAVLNAERLAEANHLAQLEWIRRRDKEIAETEKQISLERAVAECRHACQRHEQFSLRVQRDYLLQRSKHELDAAEEGWRKHLADSVERAVRATEKRLLHQQATAIKQAVEEALSEERRASQEQLEQLAQSWTAREKRRVMAVEKKAKEREEQLQRSFETRKYQLQQRVELETTRRTRAETKLEEFQRDYDLYRQFMKQRGQAR